MSTFYKRLLAASALAAGTVWDLITHPKTGGSGATVYIEQIQSTVTDDTTTATLQDDAVSATVSDDAISSTVSVTDAQTSLPDNTITVEAL